MTSGGSEEDRSYLWNISGMGFELAGSVIGMLLLGLGIDYLLGSQYKATIICMVLGLVGGAYNFIRRARQLARRAEAEYRRRSGSRPEAGAKSEAGSGMFERRPYEGDEDGGELKTPPGFDEY